MPSYHWEEMQRRVASELAPRGRRLGDSHTCFLQSLPEGGFPRVGWALIPQPFHPPWWHQEVSGKCCRCWQLEIQQGSECQWGGHNGVW